MRNETRCVKAGMMEASLGCRPHAYRRLHAGSVSDQQGFPVDAAGFTETQRAGKTSRGRVNDAVEMGIVEVETMDQHAIGEGRVPNRQADIAADHTASSLSAKGRSPRNSDIGETIGVGSQSTPQRIENQQLASMEYGLRNMVVGQVGTRPACGRAWPARRGLRQSQAR